MRMGPRLAWAVAVAGASVASAQTLTLELSPIGAQGAQPAEISPFAGLGFSAVVRPLNADVSLGETAFYLPTSAYSGSGDATLHRLSDADFKTLGIEIALPSPRIDDRSGFMQRPPASFLASQVAPVTAVASSLPSDPQLFVHAVPLPPSLVAAGGLLAGMVLLRARRLRG